MLTSTSGTEVALESGFLEKFAVGVSSNIRAVGFLILGFGNRFDFLEINATKNGHTIARQSLLLLFLDLLAAACSEAPRRPVAR